MIYNVTYAESHDTLFTQADGTTHIYNNGDTAWLLAATALVFLMIYGAGAFYSGLQRRKNALSALSIVLISALVAAIQWMIWGFSLAFSNGNGFIGDLKQFGMMNSLAQASEENGRIPTVLFSLFQMSFACVTPALWTPAAAERGRLLPLIPLVFLWNTLVYCPIAHWHWSGAGWAAELGALDFAGGSPVHMSCGAAALAYSWWLGKRRGYGTHELAYRPNDIGAVVLGTSLLLFGWLGFNGGSALSANLPAVQAVYNTLISASMGGLTWMLLDYRLDRKFSTISLCSGIIVGAVAITPCSGYIHAPSALAVGFLGAFCANFATRLKFALHVDETLDIFAVHCVGGFVGVICNGFFASAEIASLDGTVIKGGWIDHHWMQMGYQAASAFATLGYSFFVTLALVILIDLTPGLALRVSSESERLGLDSEEIGERLLDLESEASRPSTFPVNFANRDHEYPPSDKALSIHQESQSIVSN